MCALSWFPATRIFAPRPGPEAVDQAVRRAVHGNVGRTDHRVVVPYVVRPLLQQLAAAVVAVPERASEEGDARLVSEVRVGEHPRPVFLTWVQSCAHQPPGHVQHGRGSVSVVSGDTVPRPGGQSAPHGAVEARSRSCPFRPGVTSLVRLPGPVRVPAVPSPSASELHRCSSRPDQTPARRACRTRSAVVSPGGIRRATRAFARGRICVRTSSGR